MLQTLRNNTKIILWVTVVAFVGLIVLVWGADMRPSSGQDPGLIGKVNGEPITYQLYQRVLNQRIRDYRNQSDRDITFDDERRLAEETWEILLNELLIAQAATRSKIPVTDDEVVFWVRNNPPPEAVQSPQFADDGGNFDIQKYHASLVEQPRQWIWYENRIRSQLPSTKMRQLVFGAAKVSATEVDDIVRDQAEQRAISYVRINPADMQVDDETMVDEELAAYYQANIDDFMTGDRARLRFVRVDKTASEADIAAVVEDLASYRAEVFKDLMTNAEEGQRTFAALASNFSDGPQAESAGSFGAARTRDRIRPTELADQVFTTAPAAMSEPFRAGNRYYLVLVHEEDADSARTFSVIERQLRAGPEQLQVLRNQIREISRQARSDGLEAAATAAGVALNETAPFTAAGFVPELLGWRQPVEFAFANEPGALGGPEESADAWVVFEVTERLDPEPYPFEQVKASVQRQIILERKRELARARAESVAEQVTAKGFEGGARAAKAEIKQSARFSRSAPIPEIGLDRDLTAAAFAMSEGQMSELLETDTGFYFARVDSVLVSPPEQVEAERASVRQRLEANRQILLFQSWLDDLRAEAKIVDYRF